MPDGGGMAGLIPDELLFIYYLEGKVNPSLPELDNTTFIGNWEEDGSSFLFFSSPSDKIVDTIVSRQPTLKLIDTYAMTVEQWHGDRIEPYTLGSLCIAPPWKVPFLNKKDLRLLLLDPGVVFGTGRHPTTETCLSILEKLKKNETIDSVLDIGTGTGLLALGAAALGCSRVWALDFNLLAVRTTLNNIRLNRFDDKILAFQAKGQDYIDLPADLLVANIHYDVMKDLIESDGFVDKSWFLLSGLLKTETRKILSRLEEKPVIVLEHLCPDGVWNTILGRADRS